MWLSETPRTQFSRLKGSKEKSWVQLRPPRTHPFAARAPAAGGNEKEEHTVAPADQPQELPARWEAWNAWAEDIQANHAEHQAKLEAALQDAAAALSLARSSVRVLAFLDDVVVLVPPKQ